MTGQSGRSLVTGKSLIGFTSSDLPVTTLRRPAWRRYSPAAVRMSNAWANLASLTEMTEPDTPQRRSLEEAAKLVGRALAQQLSSDNRQ